MLKVLPKCLQPPWYWISALWSMNNASVWAGQCGTALSIKSWLTLQLSRVGSRKHHAVKEKWERLERIHRGYLQLYKNEAARLLKAFKMVKRRKSRILFKRSKWWMYFAPLMTDGGCKCNLDVISSIFRGLGLDVLSPTLRVMLKGIWKCGLSFCTGTRIATIAPHLSVVPAAGTQGTSPLPVTDTT